MKKVVLSLMIFLYSAVTYAQDEQATGDTFSAAGNFEGAAAMYRLCMESNDSCMLKLFKLIYEEKIEAQFTDELYSLIRPLALKGDPEAQYYLGMLYKNGIGGAPESDREALKWIQLSANQNNANAQNEIAMRLQAQEEQKAKREAEQREAALKAAREVEQREAALKAQREAEQREAALKAQREAEQREAALKAQREAEEREAVLKVAQRTTTRQVNVAPTSYTNMNLPKEKRSFGLGNTLFVIGGVAVVGGAVATFALPANNADSWKPNAGEGTGGSHVTVNKNRIYLYAGCAIGAVCIGSGIFVNKKQKMHILAMGNGAGLRLTF